MQTPVLTKSDRCDRCTAAAYVAVSVLVKAKDKNVALLFCAHHYVAHEQALYHAGAVVTDNRKELTPA